MQLMQLCVSKYFISCNRLHNKNFINYVHVKSLQKRKCLKCEITLTELITIIHYRPYVNLLSLVMGESRHERCHNFILISTWQRTWSIQQLTLKKMCAYNKIHLVALFVYLIVEQHQQQRKFIVKHIREN